MKDFFREQRNEASMLKITELCVLLRAEVELPPSFPIKRGELIDGWTLVRPRGSRMLEKKIRRCGWHSIRIANESRQSGVGDSPQQAIACALKLAVRSFSEYFNAVEVRHIRLTKYPWFVLAESESFRTESSGDPCSLCQTMRCPVRLPSGGGNCRAMHRGCFHSSAARCQCLTKY